MKGHIYQASLGVTASAGAYTVTLGDVEQWLRITASLLGILIALVTLWKIYRAPPITRRNPEDTY